MIEDFIKFYTSKLTVNSIIKHGLVKNSIYWIIVAITVGLLIYLFIKRLFLWLYISIPMVAIWMIVGRYFSSLAIKRDYPEFYISKFKWDYKKIQELIFQRLDEYIIEHGYENKIEEIQRIIKERANNERLPFFMYSGGFIVLFLPLWHSYISLLLEYYKSDVKNFSAIALVIFFSILVIPFYLQLAYNFRDNVFTRYQKLIDLNQLLDEYKLWKSKKNLN